MKYTQPKSLTAYKKRGFRDALTNGKLTGICWKPEELGLFFLKLGFHLLITSLDNYSSVLILFRYSLGVCVCVYIYIYILQQYMVVTISFGGLVTDQMQYNLGIAQYLC